MIPLEYDDVAKQVWRFSVAGIAVSRLYLGADMAEIETYVGAREYAQVQHQADIRNLVFNCT